MNSPTPVLTRRRLDPQQRGSHNQLLVWDVPLTGEHRQLDAIIVPTARPPGLRFERRTDVSLKRNIGLAVARMAGWQRLMFLDDDIVVEEPDHIRKAGALLGTFGAVGLANNGFPDNSVVCHANRAAGF